MNQSSPSPDRSRFPFKLAAVLLLGGLSLAHAESDLTDAGSQHHTLGSLVAQPGVVVSFSHRVENLGPDDQDLVQFFYYLSKDDQLDAGDPGIGGMKDGPAPVNGPGGSRINATLYIPADTDPGFYSIIGMIAVTDGIDPETRNDDFVHPTEIEITAAPKFDLETFGVPTISRTSLLPNDPFQVTGLVTNGGPNQSSGYTVSWRLSDDATIGDADDIVLRQTTYNPISAPSGIQLTRNANTQMIVSSTTAPAPGNYRIGFLIEAPQDSNLNNNSDLVPGVIELLDAHPGNVDLHRSGGTSVSTNIPPHDGNFTVSAGITNTGDTTSGEFTISYFASTDLQLGNADDIFLGNKSFDRVPPSVTDNTVVLPIEAKLDAAPMTKDETYRIGLIITGGDDDNTTNNAFFVASPVTPGDAADVRMGSSWAIRGEPGLSFLIYNRRDHILRFQGSVTNDTPRSTTVALEVLWTDSSHGGRTYRGTLNSTKSYGNNSLDEERLTIPGNSTRFVDVGMELSQFYGGRDNDSRRHPGGRERTDREGFGSIFDTRIGAFIVSSQGTDATPANNFVNLSTSILAAGVPYDLSVVQYDEDSISVGGGSDRPPGFYEVTTNPLTISTTAFVRNSSRDEPLPTNAQLYLGDTPIGNPVALTNLGDDPNTYFNISAVLPLDFTPGNQELSIRLDRNDRVLCNNRYVIRSGFIVPGVSPKADLRDDPDGREAVIPDAILPGTSGQAARVVLLVSNVGPVSAGAFEVEVYASEDDVLDPGSDQLIGTAQVGSAEAEDFAEAIIDLSVPEDFDGGYYRIFWVIDTGGDVIESDEDNNEILHSEEVWVGAVVNLVEGNTPLMAVGDTFDVGAELQITGTRSNRGSTWADSHRDALLASTSPVLGENFTVLAEFDRDSADSPPHSFRNVEESVVIPSSLLSTTPGVAQRQYLFYRFDAGNEVEEIDEDDNDIALGELYVFSPGRIRTPRIVELSVGEIGVDWVNIVWASRSDRNYQLDWSKDIIAWSNVRALESGRTPQMEAEIGDAVSQGYRYFRVLELNPAE